MRCLYPIACLFLPLAVAEPQVSPLGEWKLNALEERLSEIDTELSQLASFSLRGGMGSLGYKSKAGNDPHRHEHIRIELGEESAIDQVVLVPALFREPTRGVLAEGFPSAFRIIAGTEETSRVVATFTEEDDLLPRIAPLAVSFPPVNASWITIEATTLSHRFNDGKYLLQLSEVMAFSGTRNVALHKPSSFHSRASYPGTQPRFLTDGFTPFLMDAVQDESSKTKLIRVKSPASPLALTVDLQKSYPISQINLHTADVSLSIPMTKMETWAVPRHVSIMGANRLDFADETLLCEYRQRSVFDTGPIICLGFPENSCRYIRLKIHDHIPIVSLESNPSDIGFSEIEVISESRNVAKGTPITLSTSLVADKETLERITDGLNYNGKILPTREWMNQLAKRHDMEKERPLIIAELNARYARQKAQLRNALWGAAILIAGTISAILIYRKLNQRRIVRLKERFAADLHDELGANLHSIGLLSDLAEEVKDDPGELSGYLQRIRAVSSRSGRAMRNMVDMNQSNNLFHGLKIDMQRAADRIVTQLDHDFGFEGEENVTMLKPQTRIDLYLFYKECLINACRHSGASHVSTKLVAKPAEVTLIITDNGRGLPTSPINGAPPSLKRRAKLLKARLTVENPPKGGTRITLKVHPRGGHIRFFRRWKQTVSKMTIP